MHVYIGLLEQALGKHKLTEAALNDELTISREQVSTKLYTYTIPTYFLVSLTL